MEYIGHELRIRGAEGRDLKGFVVLKPGSEVGHGRDVVHTRPERATLASSSGRLHLSEGVGGSVTIEHVFNSAVVFRSFVSVDCLRPERKDD